MSITDAPRPTIHATAIWTLAAVVGYVLSARLAEQWTIDPDSAQPFWPAAGVPLAFALHARSPHGWLVVGLGTGGGVLASHVFLDNSLAAVFVDIWANSTEAVVAWLLIRLLGAHRPFDNPSKLVPLMAAIATGVAVGATIAALGFPDVDEPWTLWRLWFTGDGLGMLAVAPLGLLAGTPWLGDPRPNRRTPQLVVALVGIALLASGGFAVGPPAELLAIPALGLLAVQFGPRAGVPATVAVACYACIQTSAGNSSFGVDGQQALDQVQLFNVVIVVSTLALAASAVQVHRERTRLSGLLDALPDVVVIADRHGTVRESFGPHESGPPLGLPPGASVFASVAPHDRERVRRSFEDLLFSGRSGDVFDFDDHHGTEVIEARSVLLDADNVLILARTVTRDVAVRSALAAARRRWEMVARNSREGMIELDREGVVTAVSRQFAEMIGLPTERIVGLSYARLFEAEGWDPWQAQTTQVMGGEQLLDELTYVGPGGEPRRAMVWAQPMIDASGSVAGATIFATDTTARHATEEARRQLEARLAVVEQEERRQIARELHDGPLQELVAVDLRLGALRRTVDGTQADRLQAIEAIVRGTITQLRSSLSDLVPPDVVGGKLLEALLTFGRHRLGPAVELEVIDRAAAPPLGTQAVTLYHLGREALNNVARHAGAASVTLTLSYARGGYRLELTDDGCGIDPADSAGHDGHMGIRSMLERAAEAGGWCAVEPAEAGGTTVTAWVPWTAPYSDTDSASASTRPSDSTSAT